MSDNETSVPKPRKALLPPALVPVVMTVGMLLFAAFVLDEAGRSPEHEVTAGAGETGGRW